MSGKNTQNTPQVHLDVDWLVGKRADPRLTLTIGKESGGVPIAGVALGVLATVCIVIAFPQLSTHWVQHRIALDIASSDLSAAFAEETERYADGDTNRFPESSSGLERPMVYQLTDIDPSSRSATRRSAGSLLSMELEDKFFPSSAIASVVRPHANPLPQLTRPTIDSLLLFEAGDESLSDGEFDSSPRSANLTLVSSTKPKFVASGGQDFADQVSIGNATAEQSVAPNDSASAFSQVIPLSIENQTLESLLGMLGSAQPKIAKSAFDELLRRGMSTASIEIAIDFARSASDRQIELMEQVVRSGQLNPIPFLSWMGQNQEPRVRHKAISLLGALRDPESSVTLRQLAHREPDQHLQQLIRHALQADGNHQGR